VADSATENLNVTRDVAATLVQRAGMVYVDSGRQQQRTTASARCPAFGANRLAQRASRIVAFGYGTWPAVW
jgi:hypothetical protein